jgi:ATP-dependent protease Clp ATPase subunit
MSDTESCAFCAKTMEQVDQLIAGPDVFICNECIALCSSAIQERPDGKNRLITETTLQGWSPAAEDDRAVLHNLLREEIRNAFEARDL